MPSASTAIISNSEIVANANEATFGEIKALATEFEKRDSKAKKVLYTALQRLFEFVLDLETDADRRQFIETQNGKWGKVARENPFQPFVKLAFDGKGISDASRSQYAKVLYYAQFEQDKSVPLAEWLDGSGGIEGLYAKANSFLPSQKAYVDEDRLAEALTKVRQRRQSTSFKLDNVPDLGTDVKQGYVMAILHVDQHGNSHVVEYSESDQAKIAAVMKKIARPEAKEAMQAAKPYSALAKAITLLSTVTATGKADADRLFTMSNETGPDGAVSTVVRVISTAYEGTLGEVALSVPIEWVPEEGTVAFTQANAESFCRGFEIEGRWLCDVSSTPLTLNHSDNPASQVTLIDGIPEATFYRARRDFLQVAPLKLLHDAAKGFLEERGRKQSIEGAYRGALPLTWDNGHLEYRPSPNWPSKHELFELQSDPALGDDRMFSAEMVASVCQTAVDLKSDIVGWLVSTPEEDTCAIMFDYGMGKDRASVVMPLVKTRQCHTTQTNCAVD
ncbi:hypothetical protein [Novosphingobium beihaiensis]|uniref:Uncharacterized protein n=1 Tax=Novosphingobium beihaiensis TaxID=2930389 RepID=A0ABT0BVI2_9SPHN|nr:hypothetical protein [Novosphingobium beihaiensis]MCJ2189022.1 hypothetical protein [Novosphingobium beihaiensis]